MLDDMPIIEILVLAIVARLFGWQMHGGSVDLARMLAPPDAAELAKRGHAPMARPGGV